MLFRTEGIVIKTFEYGEADLIVTFFTIDKGKIKGIAKSCRKTKSRFGSSLEPFTHSKISLYGKETSALPKITQSDILHSHRKIREDLFRLAHGAYIAELIYEICPEGETNKGVFHLFSSILNSIESDIDIEILSLIFEVRFLRLMGYQPRLNSCVRCGRKAGNNFRDGGLKFYPNHGGILCEGCSNPEEGFISFNQDTRDLYYKILTIPLPKISDFGFWISDLKSRGELKTILTLHLSHILGKKLKSANSILWAI